MMTDPITEYRHHLALLEIMKKRCGGDPMAKCAEVMADPLTDEEQNFFNRVMTGEELTDD
jgi:hypothetical protein